VLITLPFFIPPILTATAGDAGQRASRHDHLVWRWLTRSKRRSSTVYSYGGVVWHMMPVFDALHFLFVVEPFAPWTRRSRNRPHVGRHALADLLAHHLRADAAVTTAPSS